MSIRSVSTDSSNDIGFLDEQEPLGNAERSTVQLRDRVAQIFYSSARLLMMPLWTSTSLCLKTVSICQNSDLPKYQKITSIATSAFTSCVLLPFTLAGLTLGQMLHFSAFHLATTPYIHLAGKTVANEQPNFAKKKIFQQNCCLTAGGFARLFGGLELPDEQRTIKIAETIKQLKPDVICLQEVSDLNAAFSLYDKLSSEFTDFYLDIGVSPLILKNNSGLFVASKYPITNPQFHSFSDIPGTESMVNKGYFTFSIPWAYVINTHLSPSLNDLAPTQAEIETRAEEQRRIAAVKEQQLATGQPVFVLGDFNTNQEDPLHENAAYRSDSQSEEFRCQTDYLVDRNWRHNRNAEPNGIVLDHCLAFSNKPLTITTQPIPAFEMDRPSEAVSDHPGILHQVASSNVI